MSLSYREQILLSILLVVALIVGGYYVLFEPMGQRLEQVRNERSALQQEYDQTLAELNGLTQIKEQAAILTANISERTKVFYPSIIQEELLVMLHQLSVENQISYETEGYNLTFVPEVIQMDQAAISDASVRSLGDLRQDYQLAIAGEQVPSDKPSEPSSEASLELSRQHLNSLEGMNLTLNFESTYAQAAAMISGLENLNRSIRINSLNLSWLEASALPLMDADNTLIEVSPDIPLVTGTLDLTFYAIPKLVDQDEDYLTWELEPNTGKTDPFAAP